MTKYYYVFNSNIYGYRYSSKELNSIEVYNLKTNEILDIYEDAYIVDDEPLYSSASNQILGVFNVPKVFIVIEQR